MNKLYITVLLLVATSVITGFANSRHSKKIINNPADTVITLPAGGNSWRVGGDTSGGTVTNDGIVGWTKASSKFVFYFRVQHTGNFKLWLNLKTDGKSVIAVSALKNTKQVSATGNNFKDFYVGEWLAKDTGYIAVTLSGVSKTGKQFAEVGSMRLSGTAITAKTAYVPNNEGNYFHWGRRGPSVHLAYEAPKVNAEWFYNEVTVPVGNDVIGSYFMADGFNVGYFGMQVNSPTERHILFSVWSPFTTDDPKAIPDSQKIVMLKKGANVHTGEFGNEGSGGQSYMLYNWKAGNTYRFLIHAKPGDKNHTAFTAWFYAPELGKWQLLASFNRPQTLTYLVGLHSFLENFEPEGGTVTRQVKFSNGWVADANGRWTEVTKAKFTNDATAQKGYRMDYAGGVEGSSFFLRNCGFFNNYTKRGVILERAPKGKAPVIDFDKLP